MNTSEIIPVIAIVTSSLVSIISLLVSYYINKSNIIAKRSEIAFENRLEALRETTEKIRYFGYAISNYININSKDNGKIGNYKSNCLKALEDLVFTYWKQSVYFPPEIDKAIGELRKLSVDYLNQFEIEFDGKIASEWFSKYTEKQNQINVLIQEFIGFK